jgi:S-adenosylmethionine decarboxylase
MKILAFESRGKIPAPTFFVNFSEYRPQAQGQYSLILYIKKKEQISLDGHIKLGEHFICDFSDCDQELLLDGDHARELFTQAVRDSQLTIVSEGFYKFSPHGFTCFLLLAESHASLHAWPEYGYCAVDLFTCNLDMDIRPLVKELASLLKSDSYTVRNVDRVSALVPEKELV